MSSWSAQPSHLRDIHGAENMLDLEVQPERSLGNEQWEFILGESTIQNSRFIVVATATDLAHLDTTNKFRQSHRQWTFNSLIA